MRTNLLIAVLLILSATPKAEVPPVSLQAEQQFANNQFDSAIVSYGQFLQENPENKEAYFNRGLCFYKLRKFSEAIFDFEKCLKIDSSFAAAELMKGFALEKRGDLKEALVAYKNVKRTGTNRTLLDSRIKIYCISVILSKNWYYMIAMMLLVILLMAAAVKSVSFRKEW